MSVRLIATDLDGTLLGSDKTVSLRNRRALRACLDRGIAVMLASGRSFHAIARIAREADLQDCLVMSSNGARLDETVRGSLLFEDNIPRAVAKEAAARLIDAGIYVECYSDEMIYMANRTHVKHHDHQSGLASDGVTRFVEDAEQFLTQGTAKARKLIVFSDDAAVLYRARLLMEGLPLDCSSSDTDNLEIMAHGAGKGRALLWYARQRAIKKSEIMAFGDQLNDLPLLENAGWPVAMGNAVRALKECARLTAPDHDSSGVAEIIEKYVLEGEI